MRQGEINWEKLVIISMGVVLAIVIFKILFWVSLAAIFVGVVWLLGNLWIDSSETSWIPLALLVIGLVFAPLSYQVGYEFEKSELGATIVDTADVILDTNEELKRIEKNITEELIGVLTGMVVN